MQNLIQNSKLAKIKKRERGFSLIEMVVATAILAFAAVIAISSNSSFNRMVRNTQTKREAISAFQTIYETIGREVWGAQSITLISDQEVRITPISGSAKTLSYANNSLTLDNKKIISETISLSNFDFDSDGFYLKTKFDLKTQDKTYDTFEFIHTLRAEP